LSNGNFVVFFEFDEGNPANNDDVFIQLFNASGGAIGGNTLLGGAAHGAGLSEDFRDAGLVTELSNGNLVVTWETRDSVDGDGQGAFAQVFNGSTGVAISSVITPYADGTGNQKQQGVAALAGGGFVFTWLSDGGVGDVGEDVYQRVYNNSGNAVSTAARINTSTAGDQDEPIPLGLSNGNFVVFFEFDEGNPANNDDVFIQLYEGPPVVAVDTTAPTVTSILRQVPMADPTNANSVTFRVTFDEDVQNVGAADFSLSGSASGDGTVGAPSAVSASVYDVEITGLTNSNGIINLNIANGNDVEDLASNALGNSPTIGSEEEFNVDNTAPTVTIGAPSATDTTGGPVTYTVTYVGADAVTLANPNVTLNTTGTATGAVNVTGAGTSTRTVTISGVTGDGTLGISLVAATANDDAGNTAAAAGPSTTFNVDNTAPTPVITGPASPTSNDPVVLTIDFSEAMTGFIGSDITVSNGTVASLIDNGNGNFTANIDVTANGLVSVDVNAAVATDIAGNSNNAATQYSVNAVLPTIIDNGDPGYTGSAAFTGFAAGYLGDLDFGNGMSPSSFVRWDFPGLATGLYRVSATWDAHDNRATNSQFRVFHGATPLATVPINQRIAPNDFTDQSVGWEDLGAFYSIDASASDTISVLLFNNGNGTVIADAVRLALVTGPAEIEVHSGVNDLVSGSSTVDFGLNNVGAVKTKTFEVKNIGGANLSLSEPINVPSGYTISSSFGSTTLMPGETTTFDARFDAASQNTFSGNVSFGNGDGDENPFMFSVTGIATVEAEIQVLRPTGTTLFVDDADLGFFKSGGWAPFGAGKDGNLFFAAKNSNSTATWTFRDLTPGTYRVSATWADDPNRAKDAPFTIFDNTAALATVDINQENAPDDLTDMSTAWEDIGIFTIESDTLKVQLTSDADEYIIADAVRIELLQDLTDGTSSVDFGSTPAGAAVTQQLIAKNHGFANLTLSTPISPPTGFSVPTSYNRTTLVAGDPRQDFATFTLQLDASGGGPVNESIALGNSDSDENPFDLTLTGDVTGVLAPEIQVFAPSGNPQIIDNGSAGFTNTAGWTSQGGQGFSDDVLFSIAGSGTTTATWSFSSLTPGTYRVSATWVNDSNRANSVTYTTTDGTDTLATRTVDQLFPPNDFSDSGTLWEDIGFVTITGSTIEVDLNNLASPASKAVIADAVRIDPMAELVDGTSTLNVGSVATNVAAAETLLVKNVGNADLTLSTPISVPAEYSVPLTFGSTTLTPGTSTTFAVALNGTPSGTHNGTVSFGNNDADENTFDFNITGTVVSQAIVIDDGDVGFSAGGTLPYSFAGFSGDTHSSKNNNATATWSFTGLAAGTYRVSTTWLPHPNRATNAVYSIDGTPQTPINQEVGPAADVVEAGTNFQDLTVSHVVSGSTLTVSLTDIGADEYVIPDAVRIERLGPLHASSRPFLGTGVAVTPENVNHLFAMAVDQWAHAATPDQFSNVEVRIADLSGTILGLASEATETIWVDADAAGHGWQLDVNSRKGGIDLVTVLSHELGHLLGRADLDPVNYPHDIMTSRLAAGVRRGSASGQLEAILPAADGLFADIGYVNSGERQMSETSLIEESRLVMPAWLASQPTKLDELEFVHEAEFEIDEHGRNAEDKALADWLFADYEDDLEVGAL
jgi:hypothetical protein